jgi:hypothetical protein
MLAVLVNVLALSSAQAAIGQWSVRERVDSMTDVATRFASITNKTGHRLEIYRLQNGEVWGTFVLPEKDSDVLSTEKGIVFRIDKNEPNERCDFNILQQEKSLRVRPSCDVQPKWRSWLLDGWKSSTKISKTLSQFFNGKRVLIRYYLFTGGYKETEFSLEGASPMLLEVTGKDRPGDE